MKKNKSNQNQQNKRRENESWLECHIGIDKCY